MVNIRKTKTALKFESPASWWASSWREALPCGNGIIGASVYGGAGDETIMISHNSLKWQGRVVVLPDVADKLKEVRDAIVENPREAEKVLPNALLNKSYRPEVSVPLPLCDFKVRMPLEKPARDYMRVLNMENGEISVVFRDGSTKFDRSMFVSRINDYIVYEINRSGSKPIDVEFSIDMHNKQNVRTPEGVSSLPNGINTKYEKHFIYFAGRDDNGSDFGAVAKVSHYGGTSEVVGDSIKVSGANNVIVLIKTFVDSQRDKEWKAGRDILANEKTTYEKMLKEHSAVHSKLFGTMDIDLDADERDMSVDELLRETRNGDMPIALVEKLWAYGRYLFISSTRENGQICTPYGLWCGDYKAPKSFPQNAGLVQQLYSHTLQGGLENFVPSILNYYEGVMDDLKKNAMRLYGCRGIFVPSQVSPAMGLIADCDPKDIHFTGCAGWLCGLFYDYCLYADDKKLLKERVMPFMKETVLFYEDFMKIDGDDGLYSSSPSYSLHTTPGNFVETSKASTLSIAQNSTIDFAILKQLLNNLISGSAMVGLYKNDVEKWKDMLKKIPEYKINSDGCISEYISNKFTDNYKSCGTSHLYPVYCSDEINCKSDSELIKAFSNSAKKRMTVGLQSQTSWSLANLANVFAILGDGDTALDNINLIVRSSVMNNLVTAENDWRGMGIGLNDFWAPYQMQANLGITNAIQNMIVYSTENEIMLLPSLPEAFKKGAVKGCCTKAGAEISINWDKRKGNLIVNVKSRRTNKLTIHFPEGTKKIVKGSNFEDFNAETLVLKDVPFQAGKVITYECKWSPAK